MKVCCLFVVDCVHTCVLVLLHLACVADGDARSALNLLELAVELARSSHSLARAHSHTTTSSNATTNTSIGSGSTTATTNIRIGEDDIKRALQRTHVLFDKTYVRVVFVLIVSLCSGEQHYDVISALHKSLRGSDANAALYWLGPDCLFALFYRLFSCVFDVD